MTRDRLYLPPATAVYTTYDAAGRPHVCPAMLRYAEDAAFRERVDRRAADRIANNRAAFGCAAVAGG